MEDLIIFPESGYKDSGEGGLAVFFILCSTEAKPRRQKCIAGQALWPVQDVVIGPPKYVKIDNDLSKARNHTDFPVEMVDLVMLVASTRLSLWNDDLGYWCAEEKDLTSKGKQLFDMLTEIMGQKPDIVTLLDT